MSLGSSEQCNQARFQLPVIIMRTRELETTFFRQHSQFGLQNPKYLFRIEFDRLLSICSNQTLHKDSNDNEPVSGINPFITVPKLFLGMGI